MKPFLEKLDALVATVEKGLVVCLFLALAALIVFNIVSRNLFHLSFQRLLEIPPVLVLWLALLGSSLALRTQGHIRLELVVRHLPPALQRLAAAATGIFGVAVTGTLFWASFAFVRNEVAIFGAWGWLGTIFPLFFAVSCFRFLHLALRGGGDVSGKGKMPAAGGREGRGSP